MSDAPILAAPSHITDMEAASDFEKKHTPYLSTEEIDGKLKVMVNSDTTFLIRTHRTTTSSG
jgi:desulfoferrodoxin (superoxide reductase-like protein)